MVVKWYEFGKIAENLCQLKATLFTLEATYPIKINWNKKKEKKRKKNERWLLVSQSLTHMMNALSKLLLNKTNVNRFINEIYRLSGKSLLMVCDIRCVIVTVLLIKTMTMIWRIKNNNNDLLFMKCQTFKLTDKLTDKKNSPFLLKKMSFSKFIQCWLIFWN